MSRSREVILASYEAWNRDDLDAYLETLHPDVKFHTSGIWPDFDAVYSRRNGLAEFWRRIHEPWKAFRIDVEHIDERGDCFAARVRLRARGVDSGLDIDMHMAHGFRVRDGLLVEIFSRRTFEEACEALGLRQSQSGATAWAMSENVEVVRRSFDAWNEANVDGIRRCYAEDAVVQTGITDLGGTFEGKDPIGRWAEELLATWADCHFEAERIFEAEDVVVSFYRVINKGRESGVKLMRELTGLYWIRDGKIAREQIYLDRQEALDAAGVPG